MPTDGWRRCSASPWIDQIQTHVRKVGPIPGGELGTMGRAIRSRAHNTEAYPWAASLLKVQSIHLGQHPGMGLGTHQLGDHTWRRARSRRPRPKLSWLGLRATLTQLELDASQRGEGMDPLARARAVRLGAPPPRQGFAQNHAHFLLHGTAMTSHLERK